MDQIKRMSVVMLELCQKSAIGWIHVAYVWVDVDYKDKMYIDEIINELNQSVKDGFNWDRPPV